VVAFDDLWGGQLTSVEFDPVEHVCVLKVTTNYGGQAAYYILTLKGVVDFRFHSSIPDPWTYAELTELHLEADKQSGLQTVELLLWSEDAGLTFHCMSTELREVSD
jgi:hypothetical protein